MMACWKWRPFNDWGIFELENVNCKFEEGDLKGFSNVGKMVCNV